MKSSHFAVSENRIRSITVPPPNFNSDRMQACRATISASEPVRVADPVGAGDAFTAGLISGTLWGWPPRSIATLANEVGALVASRTGAMPRVADELIELRDRIAREHRIDARRTRNP